MSDDYALQHERIADEIQTILRESLVVASGQQRKRLLARLRVLQARCRLTFDRRLDRLEEKENEREQDFDY